jgi:hypothetical protein
MTTVSLPHGSETVTRAVEVLRAMAGGRAGTATRAPAARQLTGAQDAEPGIVVSLGRGVAAPAAWLAAALGRRYVPVGDCPGMARLVAELQPSAAILVALADDLHYGLLKEVAVACRASGTPWGLVTGTDAATVAYHAWKVATAPCLGPDDVGLLDLLRRRLVVEGRETPFSRTNVTRLLLRPPRCLILVGHGDGTHASINVAATQLCGVLGDIERDNSGQLVEGGCAPGSSCRRLRAQAGQPVAASLLPVDVLVHVSCNGTSFPGRFLPTQSSVAYAALSGGATAIVSPASHLEDAPQTGQRIHDCLTSGGTLAEVAALLSDPDDEWVVTPVLGDASWRPVPAPGPPLAAALPSAPSAPSAPQREDLPGLRERLDRIAGNLADLAGIRQALRNELGVDVLPVEGALREPVTAAVDAAACAAEPGQARAAARALDSVLATADGKLLDEVSARVLPLGQYAFDPGSLYVVAGRRPAAACPQCGEDGLSIVYRPRRQGLPSRVVECCPLCGPTAIRRPHDPRPRMYSQGPVRRGQRARIVVDLSGGAAFAGATVNAFLIGREDGGILQQQTATIAFGRVDFGFDLPALLGPDILRICAVVGKDLGFLMVRGRIAVQ